MAKDPRPSPFAPPPTAAVTLWWLGQSGFVLSAPGVRVAIDPYLSPRPDRTVEAPCAPEDLADVDAILVTHEHRDHLDLATLRRAVAARPDGPPIVLPAPLMDDAAAAGLPNKRLIAAQPGDVLRFGPDPGAAVWPVPARHGRTSPPAVYDFGHAESDGRYRYLGYVVRLGGVTLYHSGDSLLYEGLADRLRELRVDVALLPINGRDFHREGRNILGNMTEREAADVAAEAGCSLVVPMHYELFAHNPGDPGRLVEYVRRAHPELTVAVPSHMRGLTVSPVAAPGGGQRTSDSP